VSRVVPPMATWMPYACHLQGKSTLLSAIVGRLANLPVKSG